jgi:hypothetical protein
VILNEYGIIGQNKKRVWEYIFFEMPQLVVFYGGENLSNFFKCFWSTTCKLGIKRGKRIIFLKLIMAMDAIVGIGISCCTLSPSK